LTRFALKLTQLKTPLTKVSLRSLSKEQPRFLARLSRELWMYIGSNPRLCFWNLQRHATVVWFGATNKSVSP
jgi:hypothetical protein